MQLTSAAEAAKELGKLPKSEALRLLMSMEDEMTAAAEALDFEQAARLRDQVVRLRVEIEGSDTDEVMSRLKQGARKGSAHGVRKRRK